MMPETAKRTARVPILGEDGRISDDYIPAAIGEGVESAEAAATRAETAATAAEGSATAAGQSAASAQGSASAAGASASKAQESAATASGAVTQAQSAQQAAEAAKTGAESARDSAQTSASQAQQSAMAAAESAKSVADKFITSAQATTLEPGSQATASVADQVLTVGIPRGDKGDPGEKGDPGTGVPDGGTPGQLLSKTDSGTAWVDPPSTGNVVTSTAEGYVAHAEDAYAQKPIEVRIKGRTVKNLWPNKDYDYGGSFSIVFNEDGALVVSINSSSDAMYSYATLEYTGKQNVNYSLFVDKAFTGFKISIRSKFDGSNSWKEFLALHPGETIDTNHYNGSFSSFDIVFEVDKQTTIENETFKIMFIEGDELQGLILRPGLNSVQPKNLVTAGKNLVNTSGASVLSGTFGVRLPNVTLQPGTYVVKRPSGLTGNFAIYREGDTSANVSAISEAGTSFTLTSPIHGLDFRSSDAGQITLDNISQFQLELGSTATAYEPPNVTTTPLPEVELRSLPDGTCDKLVIKEDGTCEVERRTGYIASYTDEEVAGEYVSTGNGLEAGASIVYELDEPTTEPQSPVTLPTLPAPTFNQYHAADISSDTAVTYARDINIVIDNLAKQIAGTAATVAINEATR